MGSARSILRASLCVALLDIAARVRETDTDLRACRARLSVGERAAVARVRRAVLPIGYGNAVSDIRFEPASAALEPFRACLQPIVRRWQIGRPETHEPVDIVVEGPDLRRILRDP